MLRRIETKWLIAIAFVLGLFLEVLDMTVLNTALPTIGRDFRMSDSGLQFVLTGYLVSLAIFIPASGWVADRFGTKRTFAFAIFVFTAASAFAGMAQSSEWLIVARIIQGVGGGMLTPVGTTMLYRAFPNEERAKASSVLSIPVMIAPALGPILGGWLTDNVSWRWIFYLNLPIGIIGLVFTLMFVPNQREDATKGFDLIGFILAGAGLSTLLVGLDRAPRDGWSDPWTAGLLGAGTILLVAFAVAEMFIREPLLDLRLLRDRNFAAGNAIQLVSNGAMMGIFFLVPLLLQQLKGLDATQSGLVTLFQVFGMMLVMPLGMRLYPVFGARRMMAAGFLGLAATIFLFSTFSIDSSLWAYRGVLFLMGVAIALVFVPMQTAAFESISSHDTANASSLFSTMRQFASAAGVAAISTVLATRTSANLDGLGATASAIEQTRAVFDAYDFTFVIAAIISLAGVAAVFAFRRTTGISSPSGGSSAAGGSGTPAVQPALTGAGAD